VGWHNIGSRLLMATNGRKSRTASADTGGLWETAQRFWRKSYAGDYSGLIILLVAYLLIQFLGKPFHQRFRLDDPRIQFPHAEVERVSVFWLFIYAAVLPAGILIMWMLVFRPSIHKTHVTLLGLAVSIILTCFVTDVLKDAVGRPRPDFLARCVPKVTTSPEDLVTIDVCTASGHVLQDGWRSFPSGHSSFSFAGLGYLSMFFASQTHVFRPRASLMVVLLCAAPLLAAALITISRLEDYRHDHADVICGSLLGFSVAYFNWRRYYPSLLSKGCHDPYEPPASRGTSPSGGGFQRVRDEEEGFGMIDDGQFDIGDEMEGYGREGGRS